MARIIEKVVERKGRSMEERIMEELKSKPVYYLQADKGNKIVIMDRSYYNKVVMEKLENGNFHELRANPLTRGINGKANYKEKGRTH